MVRRRTVPPLQPLAPTSVATSEIRLIDTPNNLTRLVAQLRTAFTVVHVSAPRWSRVPGMQRIYVTVEVPAPSPDL